MNNKLKEDRQSQKIARANCPYCGKAMERGSLSDSGYKMKWKRRLESSENRSLLGRLFQSDVQRLGTEGYGSHIKGFRCENCKKLILSYE